MNCPFFQVDAFANQVFSGNSACVVILQKWPKDSTLLNIARENAVAETAFIVTKEGRHQLRWFTPDLEIDLCGHATLAAGHVILHHFESNRNHAIFETASGVLEVHRHGNMYRIDLPNRPPVATQLPDLIAHSLSKQPLEVLKARDYVLVYAQESDIIGLKINREQFDKTNLDPGGVAATAPGATCDFVSRFFTPQATILEDPVTGSAHCSLAPFWGKRLGKRKLNARQISMRGGELQCEVLGDRVLLFGHAVTYAEGELHL